MAAGTQDDETRRFTKEDRRTYRASWKGGGAGQSYATRPRSQGRRAAAACDGGSRETAEDDEESRRTRRATPAPSQTKTVVCMTFESPPQTSGLLSPLRPSEAIRSVTRARAPRWHDAAQMTTTRLLRMPRAVL